MPFVGAGFQVKNLQIVGPPQPEELMQASVRQVLRRLDKVDPGMRDFFMTAAKTVCEGTDPAAALAAALASLSGISSVPKSRSLLTQVGLGGPAGGVPMLQ